MNGSSSTVFSARRAGISSQTIFSRHCPCSAGLRGLCRIMSSSINSLATRVAWYVITYFT